jgi:hypothetical protein
MISRFVAILIKLYSSKVEVEMMSKYVRLYVFCILVITILTMVGCDDKTKGTVTTIYLLPKNGGQLTKGEIGKYPEVISVTSFDELKRLATERTAIWIDKDAVELVDLNWIQDKAESKVPLVLVGYNNALYSFREKLPVFGIQGPYVDWSKEKLEPGFSVGMLRETTSTSTSAFIKGYEATLDIKQLLSTSNMLLEGKLPE